MKQRFNKLVICLAVMWIASAVYAQDIIVTTDAQKIEAKITEVSKSEIRYKESDNLDGPTFVLGTEDISTIIYANGKVVLYNQPVTTEVSQPSADKTQIPSPPKPVVDESLADIILLSGQTIRVHIVAMKNDQVVYIFEDNESTLSASQVEKVTFVHTGQQKVYNAPAQPFAAEKKPVVKTASTSGLPDVQHSGRIYRDNNQYFYNNTYISNKEVERILKRENNAAYNQWKKADGMVIGGAICAGIGGGLVLGGLISLVTGDPVPCIAMECCALVPLGVGLGLCLGANAKYNKAIDIYNSKYDQTAVEFRWHVSPTEAGLAIAF